MDEAEPKSGNPEWYFWGALGLGITVVGFLVGVLYSFVSLPKDQESVLSFSLLLLSNGSGITFIAFRWMRADVRRPPPGYRWIWLLGALWALLVMGSVVGALRLAVQKAAG